jgi:hypothetical protein
VFDGWGEHCTEGKLYALNSKRCVARFEALHRLTVNQAGTGMGSISSYNYGLQPTGIHCDQSSDHCSKQFKQGKTITLKAEPAEKSRFLGWTGDCEGMKNLVFVKMNAAKQCTANFTKVP